MPDFVRLIGESELKAMLRNFPHQINQLIKLHGALAVCANISDTNRNPMDDGELGYGCARSGVYAFRGLEEPSPAELEGRIAAELRKRQSNQGPRTFARDVRRTLKLMGLIDTQNGTAAITPIGQRILEFPPGSMEAEYIALWREAILRINLDPIARNQSILRPAQLMLQIAQELPGIDKRWLALAFEASENSDEEFRRIREYISTDDFDGIMRRIGATRFQSANAVKIIPSFLEQVGLLEIVGGACRITPAGQSILTGRTRGIVSRRGAGPRRRRAGRLEANVVRPDDIALPAGAVRRVPTPEAMEAAFAMLDVRTREHQELLRKLFAQLRNVTDVQQTRDRFDLFARSTIRNEALIFEAKTGENFLLQGRLALGQLSLYEYFDVRPGLGPESRILKIAVFDGEPGRDVREFLAAYDILTLALIAGTFIVPGELGDYFSVDA